jgi:hypothetical protein
MKTLLAYFERILLYVCALVIAGTGYLGYCAYAEYAPRVIDAYQKIQKIEDQLNKLRLFREMEEEEQRQEDIKQDNEKFKEQLHNFLHPGATRKMA